MSSTAVPATGIPIGTFIKAPAYVNFLVLGASSANNLTVPPGCQHVELRGSQDFFVKWGSTGVSTATATDGTASELITLQSGGVRRRISSSLGTTAISVLSTAACNLTQAWWSI
jgi:hypothetical protein